MSTEGHCIRCENYSHWIEIIVRDEHNKPFNNIKGILYGSELTQTKITLGEEPILVKCLEPGPVRIVFDNNEWINSAQEHDVFTGEESPVTQWLEENKKGYLETERVLKDITIGDLVNENSEYYIPYDYSQKNTKEYLLSKRQKKGKFGKLILNVDKSYVLRVQGSNFITLRLGMFFDGTGNNKYSAAWGLEQYNKYYPKWKSIYDTDCSIIANDKFDTKLLSNRTFELPSKEFYEKSAVGNEPTNVEKLFNMYVGHDNEANFLIKEKKIEVPMYITGVGTDNNTTVEPSDESKLGAGLGLSDLGVEAKTKTGCDYLINYIRISLESVLKKYKITNIDGINRIEFDVFGFSRGAAVARNFINYMTNGSDKYNSLDFWSSVNSELIKLGYALCNDFDCADVQFCEVMFAGIFDTVASVADVQSMDMSNHNDRNPTINLWVNPKSVRKLIHLTADPNIEYRWNFCLNKINKASNFSEYTLYGAHSDIGGGYIGSPTFNNFNNYYLPLYENKIIKTIKYNNTKLSIYDNNKENLPKDLKEQCDEVLDMEVRSGWDVRNYKIEVNKSKSEISQFGITSYDYDIIIRRPVLVDGLLPRIYLRLMYGLAKFNGVPFDDLDGSIWNDVKSYPLYYLPNLYKSPDRDNIEAIQLGEISDAVLNYAKEGKVHPILSSESFLSALREHNLLHHSSTSPEDIVNKPTYNKNKKRYVRTVFECRKGS